MGKALCKVEKEESKVKDIVLFDMDGTLTEPRKKIGIEMVAKLVEL